MVAASKAELSRSEKQRTEQANEYLGRLEEMKARCDEAEERTKKHQAALEKAKHDHHKLLTEAEKRVKTLTSDLEDVQKGRLQAEKTLTTTSINCRRP